MKILLLSAYLFGSSFFQQDATSATSAKGNNKSVRQAQQQGTNSNENSALSATHKQPVQKTRQPKNANEPASSTSSPAKSNNTPKN